MTIKIQWTTKAIENIEEIYEFYASKNERAAVDLYNTIITATEPLKTFPEMAPIEPLLEGYLHPYRSLVVKKKYKIIYYISNDLIYITAVWDCRRSDNRLLRFIK